MLEIEPWLPPAKAKPDGNPVAVCVPLYALPPGAVSVQETALEPGIVAPGAPVKI